MKTRFQRGFLVMAPEDAAACDALVTGRGRKRHIWKVIGGNSIFSETASDAFRSNSNHRTVKYFGPLKIRRFLVPWGFNSPSRHQIYYFVLNNLDKIQIS